MNIRNSTLILFAAIGASFISTLAVAQQGSWSNSAPPSATSGPNTNSATSTGAPGMQTWGAPLPNNPNTMNTYGSSFQSTYGSPNSANGAPMGPVGNTGTNQVPGVVGRNLGSGVNATGTNVQAPTAPQPGVISGSPQTSGPVNASPTGVTGTGTTTGTVSGTTTGAGSNNATPSVNTNPASSMNNNTTPSAPVAPAGSVR